MLYIHRKSLISVKLGNLNFISFSSYFTVLNHAIQTTFHGNATHPHVLGKKRALNFEFKQGYVFEEKRAMILRRADVSM